MTGETVLPALVIQYFCMYNSDISVTVFVYVPQIQLFGLLYITIIYNLILSVRTIYL